MRATHLPSQDGAPDPYIKIDAEFNEMFSFDVPYAQLANRMLQFTVYDFDRFTRHGLIGNVIMRDLFEKSDLYHWTEYTMQIVGSQEKNDFAICDCSKAYNLRPMDITGASDPYVRIEQILGSVGQRKRVKLRKTSIKRANLNPVYHECLEFDLPVDQIGETNLLVQVMDWDRIGRDDLLGCCVLGTQIIILPPSPVPKNPEEEDQSSHIQMKPQSTVVTSIPLAVNNDSLNGANGLGNPALAAAIISNGTAEGEKTS
uniref:C2 domain-containing protein n=1 Tax=Ditylenchus dipsaci TaxID=166011 RepID=A0A915EP69_9BILA